MEATPGSRARLRPMQSMRQLSPTRSHRSDARLTGAAALKQKAVDSIEYEGSLANRNRKNIWEKRYFVLKLGKMNCYKSKEAVSGAPEFTLNIVECVVSQHSLLVNTEEEHPLPEFMCGFTITVDKTLHVAASSEEEAKKWFTVLTSVSNIDRYASNCMEMGEKPLPPVLQLLGDSSCTDVSLNGTPLSVASATSMWKALAAVSRTRSLCLDNCNLDDNIAPSISAFISNSTALEVLSLNNNNLTEKSAPEILRGLCANVSLQTVNFRGNRLGDEGAIHLIDICRTHACLQNLDLSFNMIGDQGALSVGRALAQAVCLSVFDMSGNPLGDNGIVSIADNLKNNKTLAVLRLADCKIGDDGVVALSEAIATNDMLRELDLSGNDFGQKGADALATLLRSSTTLCRLSVGRNRLSESALRSLAEVLKSGYFVSELFLHKKC